MKPDTKTELKLDDYSSYYGHVWYCDNCSERNHIYIRNGVRIDSQSGKCDKCKCTTRFGKFRSLLR